MDTQELKEYINKVLGNSIRCLLPSYWWKKIFGLVADKFDEVDRKFDEVKTWDTSMSDYSTKPVQNKVVKAYVDSAITEINESIIANEEVIAAALNDLNDRIKSLEDK